MAECRRERERVISMTFSIAEVCAACRQSGMSDIPVMTTVTAQNSAIEPPASNAALPGPNAGIALPSMMHEAPMAGMIKRSVSGNNRSSPYSGGMGSMGRLY